MVRRFGRYGRGPEELQRNMASGCIDKVSRKLFINDAPNYYYEYSVDSIKAGVDKPLPSSFKFSLRKNSFLGSTNCHGNIIGSTYANRFGLYNTKTKQSIGKYAYKNGNAMVSQSRFVSHPTKNKVVFLSADFQKIGIVEIENNELVLKKDLSWEKNTAKLETKGKYSFVRHSKQGFIDATTSEKYIFSLYSGKSKEGNSFVKRITTDTIYVFDWNLNPIKKYKLDREICTLALDEKSNVLYAATFEEGIPKIIKFG